MSAARKPRAKPSNGRRCPICGRPTTAKYKPFCSRRCADLDLGRWLGEAYRIPAVEPPDGQTGEGEDED